jgi:transcription elongation factor Elf1
MLHDNSANFICSGCGAHYRVVRVQVDSHSPDRLLHCKVCKQPLAARDGEHILKYFLVGTARAS